MVAANKWQLPNMVVAMALDCAIKPGESPEIDYPMLCNRDKRAIVSQTKLL